MVWRIYIVEDHPLMREGIGNVVAGERDLVVCGEAASALDAMDGVAREQPDVVLADISLGEGLNGIELTKRLLAVQPDLRVLMLTTHEEEVYAERALRAGARGFLMKSAPPAEIVRAIRQVVTGGVYVSDRMQGGALALQTGGVKRETVVEQLTDRELEALEHFGRGLSTTEVADAMIISPKTVETYRAGIRAKLDLGSPAAFTRFAALWVTGSVEDGSERVRGGL